MTRQQAIEVAKTKFAARCAALWKFWTEGGREPNDTDFDFHHGWFSVGEYQIGAHEYAPGPTYSVD